MDFDQWNRRLFLFRRCQYDHGLLVAATRPPVGRLVMLSKLEDALIIDGQRVELSTNLSGGGSVHPDAYRYLENFALDPFPLAKLVQRCTPVSTTNDAKAHAR